MLRACAAFDFDDLIVEPVRLFERDEGVRERWSSKYRYVMVDEYQDTNRGAAAHGQAPGRAARQPVRRRRRRPVDLQLARRRPDEHPRVRRAVPGREDRQARAELPLDEDDPRRRERGDREQQEPPRQDAVVAARRRRRRSRTRSRATAEDEAKWVAREIRAAARRTGRRWQRHRGAVPLEHPGEDPRGGAAHGRACRT